MLKQILNKNGEILSAIQSIENGRNANIFGLNLAEKCLFISSISGHKLFLCESVAEAKEAENLLAGYNETCISLFDDFSVTNVSTAEAQKVLKKEQEFLTRLINGNFTTAILPITVVKNIFPTKIKISNEFKITKNQIYKKEELTKKLDELGYVQVSPCEHVGQFYFAGDFLYINLKNKLASKEVGTLYRIEFFGSTVETIKVLDDKTLKPIDNINTIEINSLSFNVSEEEKNNFKTIFFESRAFGLTNEEIKNLKDIYNELEFDLSINKITNKHFPFFSGFNTNILSLFPEGTKIFLNNIKRMLEVIKNENEILTKNFKSLLLSGKTVKLYKNYFEINFSLSNAPKNSSFISMQSLVNSNNLFPGDVFSSPRMITQNYSVLKSVNLVQEILSYARQNYKILLLAKNEFIKDNYKEILKRNGFLCDNDENLNNEFNKNETLKKTNINFEIALATKSVIIPDEKIAIISLNNDDGNAANIITPRTIESFSEGDYVLHSNYGIGRCEGIKSLQVGEAEKDYIALSFAEGAKIFVPCENADLLSKYKGKEEAPKLSKIGSKEWEKTKTKVKESVKKLAFNLLELYKERGSLKGFKFKPDDELQKMFEDKFKFKVTPSQETAINDVKKDMESSKVMDRLICGDTGYGKTEVALRACFKAILSGKQVAFLVPTTILAFQHYNTARERMAEFGVEIELLNRFKTKKEQSEILVKLENGKCNMVIGTHRLLSEDIKFFDLGLLVLDEEQRFGVGHKEKIKNLKKNIDVLTLSATPIPRTLYLSLINVRDASIIDTPPAGRVPVSVNVLEWDEGIILDAINKELLRGGQVLIVYNNIEKLPSFTLSIKNKLPPEIIVDYGHARMNQSILEEKVLNVYENKTQVLVSTTLIENGIDLPNANTLIVVEADKMGLSQLYQLKGRVGRSDKLAFAYFTYASGRMLTEIGYKRLNAINEFTSLGSGYQIAMRDLELRGAGNILGAEQSGHMEKVGYDEYLKILDETIKELKGDTNSFAKEVSLHIDLPAEVSTITEPDTEKRIKIYKELSRCKTEEEILSVQQDLQSKYGNLADETQNLVRVIILKLFAGKAHVNEIKINKQKLSIAFYKENFVLTEDVMSIITSFDYKAILKFEKSPIINIEVFNINVKEKVEIAIKFLKRLIKENV